MTDMTREQSLRSADAKLTQAADIVEAIYTDLHKNDFVTRDRLNAINRELASARRKISNDLRRELDTKVAANRS